MQLEHIVFYLALLYVVALSCAKSIYSERHLQQGGNQTPTPDPSQHEEKEPHEIERTFENDLLAMARQHAIQVFMEKMLIALGPDFLQESHGALDNETHPTVASPLNITTDPCPEIYTKCSSEIFLSSCDPPGNADVDLWSQRRNLYFDLPHDLLAFDQLLNATLRIYKNNSLPVRPSSTLIVELYVYTKSLTKAYDMNYLYDERVVMNDYIGWISFDITDLIRTMDLSEHHGFFIKIKQSIGLYWNDPTLMVPMNCSDKNKTVVPVPFGVKTDQPEQKFPSLTIHTGMLDQYYYNWELNTNDFGVDYESPHEKEELVEEGERRLENGDFMEEINSYHYNHHDYKHKEKGQRNGNVRKMSGDDPRVFDEIYSYDDEEPKEWHPEFDNLKVQDDAEVEEEKTPLKFTSSSRKPKHLYHLKTLRKAVANQVYNGPFSVHSLDSPTPSEVSPSESASLSKEWRSAKKWSPIEAFEGHQRGVKKRMRSRRRHENNHHQRESNSDAHRSHSHHSYPLSHTHPLRSHSHSQHTYSSHETREYPKKAADSNFQTDS